MKYTPLLVDMSSFSWRLGSLRHNENVIAAGAQSKRRCDAGPVRALLGGESALAALSTLVSVSGESLVMRRSYYQRHFSEYHSPLTHSPLTSKGLGVGPVEEILGG